VYTTVYCRIKLVTAVVLFLFLLTNCQNNLEDNPAITPPLSPVCTHKTELTAAIPVSSMAVYGFQILNTYPHDAEAFTQGLQYVDGDLIEGTGLYGRSSLRRVDLETGTVKQQTNANLAPYFGEGITVFQNQIFQLTWKEQTALVYELDTMALQHTFTYETEGWGLTHDGSCLIMSDGSNILTYRDPATFAVVAELPVLVGTEPVTQLNELEFIDGEIYANIWQQNRIARISPQTGQVVGWILLEDLVAQISTANYENVLNGIAYDEENGRLFITGKRWPALFEIELHFIESSDN
jgi:glutaminyl-peptide cyclotransferase